MKIYSDDCFNVYPTVFNSLIYEFVFLHSLFIFYVIKYDDFIRDYKLDHKWSLHSEWLRMQEMLMQQWQTYLVQKYA